MAGGEQRRAERCQAKSYNRLPSLSPESPLPSFQSLLRPFQIPSGCTQTGALEFHLRFFVFFSPLLSSFWIKLRKKNCLTLPHLPARIHMNGHNLTMKALGPKTNEIQ